MVLVTAAIEENGSGLRWGSGHGYGRAADSGHGWGGGKKVKWHFSQTPPFFLYRLEKAAEESIFAPFRYS